jgi:hypothetical protein
MILALGSQTQVKTWKGNGLEECFGTKINSHKCGRMNPNNFYVIPHWELESYNMQKIWDKNVGSKVIQIEHFSNH